MMKQAKKFIAIMLAFVFVLSLLPLSALAEVTEGAETVEEIIKFTKPAYSRSKKEHQSIKTYPTDTETNKYIQYAFKNGVVTENNSVTVDNEYYAYTQLDLTGYEEILGNEGTSLVLDLRAYGAASYSMQDFRAVAIQDAIEEYDDTTITYASAKAQGLHNFAVRGTEIASDADTTKRNNAQASVDAAVLKSVLDQGYDNSVVTVVFTTISTETSSKLYYNNSECGLRVQYDPDKINNQEYVNSVAEKLTWNILSSEDANMVTSKLNLPKKFYGAGVVWTSTDEDVINSSSGEVVVNSAANTYVTLTATLSYKGISDTAVTTTKTFDVKIPKPMVEFEVNYDGTTKVETNASGPVQTIVDGISGKEASDKVIHFVDNSTRYMNPGVAGARNFEVSVLVPENNGYLSFSAKAYTPTEPAGGSIEYLIASDGFYSNYSGGRNKRMDLEPNQWHTITFAAPEILSYNSDGTPVTSEDGIKIYVDSKLAVTCDFPYQNVNKTTTTDEMTNEPTITIRTGFNRFRINGHATDPVYIDNMRWSTESYEDFVKYNAMSNVTSNVYGVDYNDKIISYTGSDVSVSDLVTNLSVEDDTTVKILRGIGSDGVQLGKDEVIADGDWVVLAAKNGTNVERTYNYYQLRDVTGKIAFDKPSVTVANGVATANLKAYNYTGSDASYKVYFAAYCNKELVELIPIDFVAKNDRATSISPTISYGEAYTAKLIILENNGITPALKAAEK